MPKRSTAQVTPEQVVAARMGAPGKRKMRATEAGALVYVSGRMWSRYETGKSVMHTALFELFLIKTNQVMNHVGATK